MSQRTFLTGLALVLLAVQACGSDDGKKRSSNPGDAGMGGEAGEPSAGGSAAGEPPLSGGAGEPAVGGIGGMGGTAGVSGEAGAGGEPSPPQPELLFSVKPSSQGLTGTAIRARHEEGLEATAIYSTRTASASEVNGTNELKLTGEDLGLAPATSIVSFAALQPEPENPTYLFSLADGSEGGHPTRVYDSFWEDDDEQANVFYSDGVPSFRFLGEGGDQFGYNALLASEVSLGLFPGGGDVADAADDLTGLVARDARAPLGELYFTIGTNDEGADGSAVSMVDPYERGCTVFKSELDGSNSVAFSCMELGLVSGDRIDGLALFSEGAVTRVVFSVSQSSSGAVVSGVRDVVVGAGSQVGSTLFESTGDGTNAVLVAARDLGLGYPTDEIDALTVIDVPKRAVEKVADCALDVDPFALDGGGLTNFGGTAQLGQGVLLIAGNTAEGARLLAYDAATCELLQQQDLPSAFAETRRYATVPVAGWSVAAPLDSVEYLLLAQDSVFDRLELQRYDAAGELQGGVPVADTFSSFEQAAVVYEAVNQRIFALVRDPDRSYYLRLLSMPRPSAATLQLQPLQRMLTMPCPYQARVTGTDASGNLYVAEEGAFGELRVCAFSPAGELLPAPYAWTSESSGSGFIVPGGAHYLYSQGGGSSIERSQ